MVDHALTKKYKSIKHVLIFIISNLIHRQIHTYWVFTLEVMVAYTVGCVIVSFSLLPHFSQYHVFSSAEVLIVSFLFWFPVPTIVYLHFWGFFQVPL